VLGVSIVLFVVLLAVLFAVAAVTAGFGDLMPPVFQDARPVGLPEGQVVPDDLELLRFNVVLRGYKMAEVDAILHRLSRELAERDAVLAELRDGGRSRSFRPEPPPLPPYAELAPHAELPTELMAPYIDPDVVELGEDTDEHPVVADLGTPAEQPQDPVAEDQPQDAATEEHVSFPADPPADQA
jgi:DivIVA domain-containing protein